jgi:hypothetical protein
MLEKFIEITTFCFKIGKPTTLGWVIFILLVIVAGIGYAFSRRRN